MSRVNVTMMQARRTLGELVARAYMRGESFNLRRRGRTVAVLVPHDDLKRLEDAQRRLDAIERPDREARRKARADARRAAAAPSSSPPDDAVPF